MWGFRGDVERRGLLFKKQSPGDSEALYDIEYELV